MTLLNLLAVVCVLYTAILFAIAFWADRLAEQGRARWLIGAPIVYTLSLSIYCTAWTFYGAVGNAVHSGLEYLTIYLGPSLVMISWWWGLRKLVRVGRSQRISSIADLLSARYGKSNTLASVVTILAVVGVTPYIALQLQSITQSIALFAQADGKVDFNPNRVVLGVTVGLAGFAILFGTRNLNAHERHHGVVMAIAVEAVVKCLAVIAVGVLVVWGLNGSITATMDKIDASPIGVWQVNGSRWLTLTGLAAAAFVCLPRMFQVMVVENDDERHLRLASWAFPTYLLLMSIFVIPIAVAGKQLLPSSENPDFFVLSLPLALDHENLAVLAFLGGFSAATSMVIVAAMSLATMVSNHLIVPLWLSQQSKRGGASMSGDVRKVLLLSRRLAIVGILGLGYAYYQLSGGGDALASIGLVAFTGIAQILPALVGGLFWRGATRSGALSGLCVGFAIWLFTLVIPEIVSDDILQRLMQYGLFGLGWLRPLALFGISGIDPVVHAALWSLSLNVALFCIVSCFSFPSPIERLQGAQFVNVFDHSTSAGGWYGSVVQSEDLLIMSQRILGASEAQDFFRQQVEQQNGTGALPDPTPAFLERLERELSASIGAAAAHAMVAQVAGVSSVSVEDLMAVADESAHLLDYSNRLEAQSLELTMTARKLRDTNTKLTQISQQKDDFLSQVSHELRTPMTSVRAFSEILRDTPALSPDDQSKYANIIHEEAQRLTRLLNDLLDLSVLETGDSGLNISRSPLNAVLDRAVATALAGEAIPIKVQRTTQGANIFITTDVDRLTQVFINLVTNAQKYCTHAQPELVIQIKQVADRIIVDFIDNGDGVDLLYQDVIFEKFSRIIPERAGGSGLGLAICREIMTRLNGSVDYIDLTEGSCFRVIFDHLDR